MSATTAERAGFWLRAALAAGSGALVFLAFPDWNIHYLAWFAHVPLLLVAADRTPRQAAWLGLIAGTITNFGGFHWMPLMLHDFGHLPWVVCWAILLLQALAQGLTMVVAMAGWRIFVNLGVPSALACWLWLLAGEAAVPMIFPWFLGNGIAAELEMVQIAELGGVYLVSALVYAVNAGLGELAIALWQRRGPALGFVATVAVAAAATYGYGVMRIEAIDAEQAAAPKLRIGLVEGNIGIWEKEARHLPADERVRTLRKNLLVHQRASADLEKQGAELILWPESAYQPYGAVPVVHGQDRFALVGGGGQLLRHDGKALLRPGRADAPQLSGTLSGLCAPRADVLRLIEDGKTIHTVAPWSRSQVAMPAGEEAVDTVSVGVDMVGGMRPGFVLSASGRMWALDWPQEPARPSVSASPWRGVLSPLTPLDAAEGAATPMQARAMGANGAGEIVAVGAGGLILEQVGHALRRAVSPTPLDLHDVAGDSLGAALVAVGAQGTIVSRGPGGWRILRQGGADLRGVCFDADGGVLAVGDRGAALRRSGRGAFATEPLGVIADFRGCAFDHEGGLLVHSEDRVWQRAANQREVRPVTLDAIGLGSAGLISVTGFQPQALWQIPRLGQRLPPARSPLPPADLTYPANVEADAMTPEFDRATPMRGFKTPLLFGAMTFGGVLPTRNAECEACFNSALLIDGDGVVRELYDKAFLLVFGEYMPFGEALPELYDLLPESSRFQPGRRTEPLTLTRKGQPSARLGVLICYEDLLPAFAQRVMAHNPEVLINLTNDAWFGQTAEPYHHLQLAQMRTIEYRRWLIRSTNTGVSAFIDAAGRRVAETSLQGQETLLRPVPLLHGQTLYARFGDWPLFALVGGLLLSLGRALGGRSADAKGKGRRRA